MFQIRCPLREASVVGRNQVALIFPGGRFTFYEYDRVVSATASRLKADGIFAGERIGLAVPRGWQGVVLFFATLRAGAVVCLMGEELTPVELLNRCKRIACGRVVVDEASADTVTGNDRAGLIALKSSDVLDLSLGGSDAGLLFSFRGDAPATINFHGQGTQSRAILHSHGSHYYGALGSNSSINLRTNDRWLTGDSFEYMETVGAAYRCALSGATLVLAAPGRSTADSILDEGITHATLSVAELEDLVGRENHDGCRLKTVLVRGTVSEMLRREARRLGFYVQTCYGIAEMTSNVTCVALNTPPEKQQTRGRALRYCDVRVNGMGFIQVRSRVLCDGYVEGSRIIPNVDHEGWFTTSDRGSVDKDGYLTLWSDLGEGGNMARE